MLARQARRQEKGWRNRIVGYGEESADQLLANDRNWRVHGKAQQEALTDVLDSVGVVQNIIVNRRTGAVVDGHLRVSLALRKDGSQTLPITYVDLSEQEEALILATLDPIAAMAAADKAKLDELLRQVDTGSAALQEMLAGLAQYPIGGTDTDRDGQGVSTTWDQVAPTDNCRVVIGDLETRLAPDVAERLHTFLTARYEQRRAPVHETLAAVIVAGMDAVETSSY